MSAHTHTYLCFDLLKNVSQATLAGSASFSVNVMEVQMQLATVTPESASTVALPSDGALAAFWVSGQQLTLI